MIKPVWGEFANFIREKFVLGMSCQLRDLGYSKECSNIRLAGNMGNVSARCSTFIKKSDYFYELTNKEGKTFSGFIFYNSDKFKPLPEWKGLSREEQIVLAFLKLTDEEHYKAIFELVFFRKFITQGELAKLGFTSFKLINNLSNHDLLIKKKYLGRSHHIIIYDRNQSEEELENYINNEYADFRYGHKKAYVKAAYEFQNKTVPKLIKLWFGKTADYITEVYKKGADGANYKFDIVALKKIKFLSKFRKIPIIIEVKNFFISNKKFEQITYFKHKLDQCYPTGYLAILVCKGAGPKEVYDRAGRMNIWLRDITRDLKKISSPGESVICETPGIPAYSH